jgi:magnesium chelatase family protein
VKVARPPIETLTGGSDSECSASVRERVSAARRRQLRRQGFVNSQLRPRSLKEVAPLEGSARTALQSWAESRFLTARGFHRAWRVALTLADLAGSPGISERHVLEALGYRLDVIP